MDIERGTAQLERRAADLLEAASTLAQKLGLVEVEVLMGEEPEGDVGFEIAVGEEPRS